jgi:hypothetical protein
VRQATRRLEPPPPGRPRQPQRLLSPLPVRSKARLQTLPTPPRRLNVRPTSRRPELFPAGTPLRPPERPTPNPPRAPPPDRHRRSARPARHRKPVQFFPNKPASGLAAGRLRRDVHSRCRPAETRHSGGFSPAIPSPSIGISSASQRGMYSVGHSDGPLMFGPKAASAPTSRLPEASTARKVR